MNNNNIFEFLPFYKKFYNTVQQQSFVDDKSSSIASFIEFPSYVDVLYLRKFAQYFNRLNRKSIDVVYGKRSITDLFFHENKKNVSSSSSRGVVVYTKDYKIFSLLLDFMARSGLNYMVKSVSYINSKKSLSFAELVISLNPEKLFTEHSIKKYKLMSLTRFFIGGFLISMMLKHIFNK